MTLFRPGDVVKITARSLQMPVHFFKVGSHAEIVSRPDENRPNWLLRGSHATHDAELVQIVSESDFELVRPAPAEPGSREEEYWDSLPVVEQQPHPEEVPDMSSTPTDRAVLAPYYLLASDEDIEKAISNLQFELSQRAYRAPVKKENV